MALVLVGQMRLVLVPLLPTGVWRRGLCSCELQPPPLYRGLASPQESVGLCARTVSAKVLSRIGMALGCDYFNKLPCFVEM